MNEMKLEADMFRNGQPVGWRIVHPDRPISIKRIRKGRTFRVGPWGSRPSTIPQLQKLIDAHTLVLCICPTCCGSDAIPNEQLNDICKKYNGKNVAIDFGCPSCGGRENVLLLASAMHHANDINNTLSEQYAA